MDMHSAIAETWNNESLIELLGDDEDAWKKFFFSSFIQALVFYAPSELDSSTGEPSERSIHAMLLLSLRFLKSNEEIVAGDYVSSTVEKWELPGYLKTYFNIDSDPTNCFRVRLPLHQLIIAVSRMRLDAQLARMAAEPANFLGNLYDYHNRFNPRLTLAGVSLNSVIFDQNIFSSTDNMADIVAQERARLDILIPHCQDLLGAVVTTIQKYA